MKNQDNWSYWELSDIREGWGVFRHGKPVPFEDLFVKCFDMVCFGRGRLTIVIHMRGDAYFEMAEAWLGEPDTDSHHAVGAIHGLEWRAKGARPIPLRILDIGTWDDGKAPADWDVMTLAGWRDWKAGSPLIIEIE